MRWKKTLKVSLAPIIRNPKTNEPKSMIVLIRSDHIFHSSNLIAKNYYAHTGFNRMLFSGRFLCAAFWLGNRRVEGKTAILLPLI